MEIITIAVGFFSLIYIDIDTSIISQTTEISVNGDPLLNIRLMYAFADGQPALKPTNHFF